MIWRIWEFPIIIDAEMQLLRTCVGQCFSECAICLLRFLKLFFFFLLFFFLSLVLKKRGETKNLDCRVERAGRSVSFCWLDRQPGVVDTNLIAGHSQVFLAVVV